MEGVVAEGVPGSCLGREEMQSTKGSSMGCGHDHRRMEWAAMDTIPGGGGSQRVRLGLGFVCAEIIVV